MGATPLQIANKVFDKLADVLEGGEAEEEGLTQQDANAAELIKGIGIEKEHTDDLNAAKEIAMDHLAEIPDYYTRLIDMEEKAEEEEEEDE